MAIQLRLDNLENVIFQVQVENGGMGSGILIYSKENNKFLGLTAKHVLYGEKYDKKFKSGKIMTNKNNREFPFTSDDIIIAKDFPELDIAVISFENFDFKIPSINYIETSNSDENVVFKGYPKILDGEAILINAKYSDINELEPKTNLVSINDWSLGNCKGLSGSGVFIKKEQDLFLTGMIYELEETYEKFKIHNLNDVNKVLVSNDFKPLKLEKELIHQKSTEKLFEYSKIELSNIREGFDDGFFIERETDKENLLKNIKGKKYFFITGKAGSGKSSFVKNCLEELKDKYNVLMFRSELLNKPTILGSLSEHLGVDDFSINLLNELVDKKETIFFIDSLEKLIETQSLAALKELIKQCSKLSKIKLIFTARSYASSDLLFELKHFFDEENFFNLEVSELSEKEFKVIEKRYPNFFNDKINNNSFFRNPFYLNLILSNIDYKEVKNKKISLSQIQKLIWEKIIKKHGLQREKIFTEIALERAFSLKYDVNIKNENREITDILVKENILRNGKLDGYYAPFHDVFEDIALIRYIDKIYVEKINISDFFENLNTKELGKRRALRLWIDIKLDNFNEELIDFFLDSIEDQGIDIYWKDEILVSILKSKFCGVFLKEVNENLKKDDFELFFRLLHLLKVYCQESNTQHSQKEFSWINLKPIGNGWEEIINYIGENIKMLKNHNHSIFKFIIDEWRKKVEYNMDLPNESKIIGEILIEIFNEIKIDGINYSSKYKRDEVKKGVYLLFSLTSKLEKEVEYFINEMNNNLENERSENYVLYDFSELVISESLKDIYNGEICRLLPDTVISIAKKRWLITKLKKKRKVAGIYFSYDEDDDFLDNNTAFGLVKNSINSFDYYPAGIYKTPIRFLLYYHPWKALKLISDIFNHVTKEYLKSKRNIKNPLINIEIELNNGEKIVQKGNEFFWGVYQGTIVAPHLLESILMTLENYLLEQFNLFEDNKKVTYDLIFNFLLTNSKNVAITSVLGSIILNNYKELEEVVYPLLRVKEFYLWDLHRKIKIRSAIAPYDNKIPLSSKKRNDSNKLEHRKLTLESIVLELQFTEKKDEIFSIIDGLKENTLKNDDIGIRNIIDRMDIRNWEKDKVVEIEGQNYTSFKAKNTDEALKKIREEAECNSDESSYLLEIGHWSDQVLENKIKIRIEELINKWNELYERCLKTEEKILLNKNIGLNLSNNYVLYFNPVILAVVGINKRDDLNLSEEKLKWCISRILENWSKKISARVAGDYANGGIGMDDVKILKSLPQILKIDGVSKDKLDTVKVLLFLTLIYNHERNDKEVIYELYRTTIYTEFPNFYSLSLRNLYDWYKILAEERSHRDTDDLGAKAKKQVLENIIGFYEFKNFKIDGRKLKNDLKTYKRTYLMVLLNTIPYKVNKNSFKLIYQNILKELIDCYKNNEREVYDIKYEINTHIANLLLKNDKDFSCNLLNYLLGQSVEFFDREYKELIDSILEEIFILVNSDEKNKLQFWSLIEVLKNHINKNNNIKFSKYLFLSMKYWGEIDNWEIISGKERYIRRIINDYGYLNIEAVSHTLSGIGFEKLVPRCIKGLKNSIEKIVDKKEILNNQNTFYYLEELIRKLYQLKLEDIKKDYELKLDIIWILNMMIESGSSLAYIVRERIISI